ncbi:limb region 1 protein homolog [Lingula anatina]|nr:limb region 1 protein homolog [Lingula anatina]|eukprot:XP_013413877.2 limb region 1 protein homolog [Lingula anatina]
MYPRSYYVQWLNSSLIHGLWNFVFIFSNCAIFVLMPFAYFLLESEGFAGSKKGLMARVYETAVVLCLLGVMAFGLVFVITAVVDEDKSSRQTLWDLWDYYLPFLYSCISLLGCLALLICTPVGFARLFTVMGQLVVKPQFLRDIAEELYTTQLEEDDLKRKIKQRVTTTSNGRTIANGHNGSCNGTSELRKRLEDVQEEKQQLEKRQQISSLRRNVGYPLMMLLLLALTALSVLWVALNTLLLVFGDKKLPVGGKDIVLGLSSLSALGQVGALLEIALILYFMLASVVGFYSLRFFRRLQPKPSDTTLTQIIGNCVVILVLSSALPVLSRILGITNFDLLGEFGRLEWLGSFYLILTYNLVFVSCTALCLFTKFTATIRKEIVNRLWTALRRVKTRSWSTSQTSVSTPTVGKEE